MKTAKGLLLDWLKVRLNPASFSWLQERCEGFESGVPDIFIHVAFSQALRHVGKSPLHLNGEEQAAAFAFHPGWYLRDWTLDQTARTVLLLSLPGGSKTVETLLTLHQTADLGEHVALARALFLLPDAKALLHIAREAMRSNMQDVFSALTQRNPYPSEYCDDIAWNQMVVKCIFLELPLREIYGLDQRRNSELSRILLELSEERRAAGRPLTEEIWRCVDSSAHEKGTWKR